MFSSALNDQAVMAQSYYSSVDEAGFCPQSKRDALSIAHSIRSESHHDMVDRSSACVSPSSELDSKSRNSTRRRIQVAKQELSILEGKFGNDAAESQRMVPDLRSYYDVSVSKIRYDLGSADPHNAYHRHPCGVDHGLPYSDEASVYSSPSSGYILPSAPPNIFMEHCGQTWNPKLWNQSVPVGRSPSGPVYPDSDADAALSQSAFYIPHSTEGLPIVPTMSFPTAEGQGTDRTLPNPSRNQAQMGMNTFTTTEETLYGIPYGYRTSNSWAHKSAMLNHGRMQSPSEAYRSGPINRSRSAQDMMFGYLPSNGSSSPLVAAGSFASALDDAVETSDGLRASPSDSHQPSRTFSHDHLSDYGSDTYVYSSSERRDKNHSHTDGAGSMLMSGLTYTRPVPGHPSPPPLVHSPAFRAATEIHHHTAMPSLNSSSEY
ncbi:streptococcal hemagglutinin protein [Aspergillus niger]|uniref:Streptococcal hemagglutinin protein n=1 Tax=Aspergillus niger TaxID=5061 RepID=A0A100IS95_ASPNG|nr:streptococcal hemagglutinin protein [Aspergillus niger]